MAFDVVLKNPGGGFNVDLATGGGGTDGYVKYFTGSVWTLKPVKYWTGSAWVQKPVKYWNGSSWVLA